MKIATAAFSGVLFGVGLAISGMGDPAKVLGFLDVTGAWNPSLAFVMGSALAVYALAYRFIRKRKPLFDDHLHLPTQKRITARLVVGAAIFGIGWGLLGYCPGPALISVGGLVAHPDLTSEVVLFVATLLLGGILTHLIERALQSRPTSATSDATWPSTSSH